ncbi:MAG: YraN family protein [Rhodospirillales bacterium]|nr:YraN family protein [Rhodospirillales bacterium]
MPRKTSYQTGLWAEELSAWYLRLKGYRILKRRYKTPVGEIDLIARKGNMIVFVEVKDRRALDDALRAVTPQMRQRITRAAHYFVSRHPAADKDLRFDLIACAPPFSIRHLDNAWQDDQYYR